MSENRLKIGITQGDPNGIGWEVILKTFADPRMTELCTPVIYGSLKAAEFYQKTIADLEPVPFHIASSIHEIRRGKINLILCGDETKIEPGTASPEGGRAGAEAPHPADRTALRAAPNPDATCGTNSSMHWSRLRSTRSRSSRTTSAIRDTPNFWRPSWAANP